MKGAYNLLSCVGLEWLLLFTNLTMKSYIKSLKVLCGVLQNYHPLQHNKEARSQLPKRKSLTATSVKTKVRIAMAGFIESFQKVLSIKAILLRRLSSKRRRARYNSEIRSVLVSPIDPPRLEYPEISGILVQAPRNWHEEVRRYLGRHCDCCNGEQMATQERDALETFIWDDEFQDDELEVEILHQGMDSGRSWSPLSEDEW